MQCPRCGNEVAKGSLFCPVCGLKMEQPPKKKGTWKIWAILGAVLVVLAAAAVFVLLPILKHNEKVKAYNEGVTQLENRNYSEAIRIFDELGDFEDALNLKDYAQMEIDYQTIDALDAAGQYDRIIAILQSRADFYRPSETEQQATALAEEYKALKNGLASLEEGDHAGALEQFESLKTLGEKVTREVSLCKAYVAEEEQNWGEMLVHLYSILKEDPACSFLENPVTDQDYLVVEAYDSGADLWDVADSIVMPDEETAQLKDTAVKGLHYEKGQEALAENDYVTAMEIFADLEGFLDADDCYEKASVAQEEKERAEEEERKRQEEEAERARQEEMAAVYDEAMQHFANGEYYKAKKLFETILEYSDAQEMADMCLQDLPENGAFATGNGSASTITIEAPSGDTDSVYLKMYDSSGETVCKVFLRPGMSYTLSISAGTYTMKVAYGTEWYGEIDLFGDHATYSQLMNGDSTEFEIEGGYEYTLQLLASTDGNVGAQDVEGGADGM